MKQAVATQTRVTLEQDVVPSIEPTPFIKPRIIFDDGNEFIHIVIRPAMVDGEQLFQVLIVEGARDPRSKRTTKEEVLEEFETRQAAIWYLEACVQDLGEPGKD